MTFISSPDNPLSFSPSISVDLANNCTVSGRTRHVEVRQYFLRQLKETNQILVRWTRESEMIADLFTKNLPTALFEKYSEYFVKE